MLDDLVLSDWGYVGFSGGEVMVMLVDLAMGMVMV